MMTYREWQVLQESAGFSLGIKKPSSVGIAGSRLSEMGFPPKGPAPTEEDDNQDPTMDMDGPAPDMGGGDDMGMDPGMGDNDVYDMSDIDPHLLALLGIKLGKAVLKMAGGDDTGGMGAGPSPDMGMDPGMGGMGGADAGGGDDGVDLDAMYGGMEDGEGAPEGEDDAGPVPAIGGKAPAGKTPFPAADDSDDAVDDDSEEDDEEGSAPPFAAKDDGDDAATEEPEVDSDDSEDDEEEGEEKPNPKFMHKGKKKKEYMCGACGNVTKEDADFFNSIFKNGKGNHKQIFDSGLAAGQVGFAPQGRIGDVR